jgi:hypothetical protein
MTKSLVIVALDPKKKDVEKNKVMIYATLLLDGGVKLRL